MIIVKLFVIAVFFIVVFANSSDYCKICPNHTLCVYPSPGPGPTCSGYDTSALLTRDDIISIVNRVNQRRNFVALGLSKLLPTAANMRKMSWSEDLAWSAQRWADQCDTAVQPDRNDFCRNLEDTLVGQNIATIFGPAPGLGVKSYIDIWFMQTLDYTGSVSFYNESQDVNTKYFTQLIWAESDSIGCGRARFYIKYTVVERLVCNFAPSGNIHGRPVYSIGIPATQCPANWRPDETYTGLCKLQSLSSMYLYQNPLALRVVNSTNNSVKQETDSFIDDFKPINVDADENDDHRHHKSRHVVNNSREELSQPLQIPMLWNNFNNSRNPIMHPYHPNRAPPRVYHGHNQMENLVPPYTAPSQQNFRRYDMLTQPPHPLQETQTRENNRRFNDVEQCTRHSRVSVNCNSPAPCISNKCTRGQHHGCGTTPPCLSQKQHVYPHNNCPCSSLSTCSPPTQTPCCGTTCYCPCHVATPSRCCPNAANAKKPIFNEKSRKSDDLHYYDLLPNLALRAGDSTSDYPGDNINTSNDRKIWPSHNSPRVYDKNKILKHKRKEYYFPKNYEKAKHDLEFTNDMVKVHDDISKYFDSGERQKRKPDDKTTYEPFLKINHFENDHSIMLKSLQYTTLRNKKIKHTWRTQKSVSITNTEPITIEVKNHEGFDTQDNVDLQHSTEKYLSFDELMHLRKLNVGGFNFRRSGGKQASTLGKTLSSTSSLSIAPFSPSAPLRSGTKAPPEKSNSLKTDKGSLLNKESFRKNAETKEQPPENYTVSVTPPVLLKHCTRRLTCTWTAAMNTNKDGSVINPAVQGGSRTPPGYVEGCTRTSTCTRDFMDRNRISTTPMPGEGEGVPDEDYCERRSLDVKKRDVNDESNTALIVNRHNNVKKAKARLKNQKILRPSNTDKEKAPIRLKRNVVNNEMLKGYHYRRHKIEAQCTIKNPMLSYGDLYYLVLQKLRKTWESNKKKHKRCSCSSSDGKWNNKILLIFIMLLNFKNCDVGL